MALATSRAWTRSGPPDRPATLGFATGDVPNFYFCLQLPTEFSRYFVLPERPAGTDDLDEEALAALVSRDQMIGVAR